MRADTREVLEVVSLLQATGRVHNVTIFEWICGRVGIVLHILGEGYKDGPLNVKLLVRWEVVRPWGHRTADAEPRVVLLLGHISDQILKPARIVDVGVVRTQVD